MSEIIAVRDLAMVTSDIQYAQRQGARQLASNLIEIGRLLVEAKTMVEPKNWEKYIWENFGYSTSSADNWMKLYREYGDNQESLFDSFRESQTFGKLSYTQLLALTALPAEERSEFVENNDVENMSTRQLQQAIRERDEARKAAAEAGDRLREKSELLEKMRSCARDSEADVKQQDMKLQKAEQEKDRAEKSEKVALDLVEKMKKQLEQARKKEKQAREELEKAKEKPDIPESIMEQLRREAEADAAGKATAEAQKKLAAAEEKALAAEKAKMDAECAAEEARIKLAAAEKSEKLANPDVMAINLLGQQMLNIWNSIQGHRMKAVAADPDNGKPIDGFLGKLLDSMRESIR